MRELKVAELLPTMRIFLSHLPRDIVLDLIGGFLGRLAQIRVAVRGSNGHFYCSSILLVYDHDNPDSWKCRMIDFVHCTLLPVDQPTIDDNYLQGIKSLMDHLEGLRETFE